MSDRYVKAVNSGFTATLAKRLGLPRPAVLRRFSPGEPLRKGPVLVLADGASSSDADALARTFLDWDLDVHRSWGADQGKVSAVVVVLTGLSHPSELHDPALELGGVLKQLASGGRVIVVGRSPADGDSPAVHAARQGIDGFVRSLAKELRAGATGNAVLLDGAANISDPSTLAAVRFFLSTKSAFVAGQLLTVGSQPADGASGSSFVGSPADGASGSGLVGSSDDGAPGAVVDDGASSAGAASSLDATYWDAPLAGRVAVVTGAARGIGASIARTLTRDGARVVVVDVPAAGDALAKVANELGGSALQLDITADDAGERLIEHTRALHGRLDIVVHNAGVTRDKLLANMRPDQWDLVLGVNIAAQLRINEALLASDLFRDAPRIVSLASTSGIAGNRGQTNYAASKGGVIGMVRATAPLLVSRGGTANAVAPGFIETDMTARIPFATREVARRLNSLQQGGQPIDVAEAIAFLASPAAGDVNGQVLRVCGQNLVGA